MGYAVRFWGYLLISTALVALDPLSAHALTQSAHVAIVPGPAGEAVHGGTLPTSFSGMSFSNLAIADINATALAGYDTVALVQVCDVNNELSAQQKADLLQFTQNGGKLVIWDSECDFPSPDYSWLPFPFASSNPGALGASALPDDLFIIEENPLGTSTAGASFVDTADVAVNTDAVGDMNIMVAGASQWCIHLAGRNAQGVAGPVQAYQRHGNGLIIWNGLDMDDVEFNASLAKIWELDLLQSFDPALGLACAATVGRLVLAPVTNVELPPGTPVTFTATATDSGGAQIGGLPVTFTIRGVNSTACNALTDASGVASCSYAGTYLGTDIITATATIASQAVTSNFATQMWGPIKLEPLDATNPAFTMHTVTATVVDLSQATNPPPPRANVDVTFDVAGANEGNGTIATTDAQGHATFTYTGDFSGLDTIRATVTICDSTETCVDYPSNPVTKHWLPSECQTKPEGSTCEAPEITGQTPGTTKCEEGVCQGSRCEISDACARARDNTTAEQAGKGTIRLTCGSGTGVASKGDVCESKGFASTGGSVIALVQPGTEQAGGTAVTRGVRRKIGRKTGRAVVRLKLSKVGRRLLKQAGARQQPLVVAVETRVTIGGQASLLRSLVSMLARRR